MVDTIKSLGATVIIAVGPGRRIPLVRDHTHEYPLWKFPGGCIEEGELPADCAVRELREETGLSLRYAQYLFYVRKRDHNLYAYYGELSSWEGLARSTGGEEVCIATVSEIFRMDGFVRDHHIILEQAQRVLRARGIVL